LKKEEPIVDSKAEDDGFDSLEDPYKDSQTEQIQLKSELEEKI
jgi:hypothetical protein